MISIELPRRIKNGLVKHTVTLYDDIDTMTIGLFSKMNKYLLICGSVGGDMADIDRVHFAPLYKIAGDKEKTVAQLNNFRQLVYFILNEINIRHLAFACLVHSVDGKEIEDRSENGLKALLEKLDGYGLTNDLVKKKLRTYPGSFLNS